MQQMQQIQQQYGKWDALTDELLLPSVKWTKLNAKTR